MEEGKKKNIIIAILTVIIVILAVLCVLFATGVICNNKKEIVDNNQEKTNTTVDVDSADKTVVDDNNNQNSEVTNNSNSNDNYLPKEATSNMSNDEVRELWSKIKGNWANVKYNDDTCVGNSIEINGFVKISKFNSDGITVWSILSFEKINNNKYTINLVSPVNLNNALDGSTKAKYTTLTIDISSLGSKKLIIESYAGTKEYDYVGENKGEFNDNHQYIDGGFKQDYYCKWYKENN